MLILSHEDHILFQQDTLYLFSFFPGCVGGNTSSASGVPTFYYQFHCIYTLQLAATLHEITEIYRAPFISSDFIFRMSLPSHDTTSGRPQKPSSAPHAREKYLHSNTISPVRPLRTSSEYDRFLRASDTSTPVLGYSTRIFSSHSVENGSLDTLTPSRRCSSSSVLSQAPRNITSPG